MDLEASVNLPVFSDGAAIETALKRTAYESDEIIDNMGTVFIIF